MKIILSVNNKEYELKSSQYASIEKATDDFFDIIYNEKSVGFLTNNGWTILGSDLIKNCIITIEE